MRFVFCIDFALLLKYNILLQVGNLGTHWMGKIQNYITFFGIFDGAQIIVYIKCSFLFCDNSIIGVLDAETDNKLAENKVTVIHKIGFKDCEIWFVRFSLDKHQKVLALGNQVKMNI